MKIKSEYKLREIAGEHILVKQGKTGTNLTRMISLNSSALKLYQTLYNRDFTVDDVIATLIETYHIDHARAEKDANGWIKALKNCQALED